MSLIRACYILDIYNINNKENKMLQDLRAMLIDFYNLDELTDKGQRELSKLMDIYSHDIKAYRDLVKCYKQLQAA